MSERAIEVTRTYRPPSHGRSRAVVVARIPAVELTYEGETVIGFEFGVCGRVETLVQQALRANDEVKQRITYSPPTPRVVASHARRARR
jgi:hypothetical protein